MKFSTGKDWSDRKKTGNLKIELRRDHTKACNPQPGLLVISHDFSEVPMFLRFYSYDFLFVSDFPNVRVTSIFYK